VGGVRRARRAARSHNYLPKGLPYASAGNYVCELLDCATRVETADGKLSAGMQGHTYVQKSFGSRAECIAHYDTKHSDLGGFAGVETLLTQRVQRGDMPRCVSAQTLRRRMDAAQRAEEEWSAAAFCALCGKQRSMLEFTGMTRDGAQREVHSARKAGAAAFWDVSRQPWISLIPAASEEAVAQRTPTGQVRFVQLLGLGEYRPPPSPRMQCNPVMETSWNTPRDPHFLASSVKV
jgi:hypothetical protein